MSHWYRNDEMLTIEQNGFGVLPEYTMENLGTSFKVILVDSAERIKGEHGPEISIPDYQGLIKKIAVTRAANPAKFRAGDIRFLRKTLGLKSKELAEKLDVGPEHISRCEAGDKVLSPNSEKVLRSLILLEAVFVLQKAVEDSEIEKTSLLKKISDLLELLKEVVSGMKISPVQSAEEELVLYFRLEKKTGSNPCHANDQAPDCLPEWLDEAA
jgi:DNA-binding transcriptional regulator YiaG